MPSNPDRPTDYAVFIDFPMIRNCPACGVHILTTYFIGLDEGQTSGDLIAMATEGHVCKTVRSRRATNRRS